MRPTASGRVGAPRQPTVGGRLGAAIPQELVTVAAAFCGALARVVALSAQAKPAKVMLKDAAGEHAIHIHQNAVCEAPFATAGGHFNPTMKKHVLDNPEGHHAGDMKNFMVAADGSARTKVTNDGVSLGDRPSSVFTGGGTAPVIHGAADDLKTDPAGPRIGCGVIKERDSHDAASRA